jgi:hypothetical protein
VTSPPFTTRLAISVTALSLTLAACATAKPEPTVRVVTVREPVAVACVPANLGDPPAYPDEDAALKSATPEVRYSLIAAGRVMRIQRQSLTEPVIKRCRDAVTSSSSTPAH